MSQLSACIVIAGHLLISATASAAEYYKLEGVKRVEKDLYKTSDRLYIDTKHCYHYAYGEDAVLKWDGEGSHNNNNKIIWDDDSSCEVRSIWKRE